MTRFLTFFTTMLFFWGSTASAGNFIGGEINYTCISDGQFEIVVTLVKDCTAEPFPANITLNLRVANGSTHDNISAAFQNTTLKPATLPTNIGCQLPAPLGCQEIATYKVTTNLPFTFGGYYVFYSGCCRQEGVTNIDWADNYAEEFLLTTHINQNGYQACNTSAISPVEYLLQTCVSQSSTYNLAATDSDADSIAYRLCHPKSARLGGQGIPFPTYVNMPFNEPGFSFANMLGGGSAFSINATTGILTVNGAQIGDFAIGVCVDEYRNGALIASTARDLTIRVRNCQTVAAAIATPTSVCGALQLYLTTPPNQIGLPGTWTVTNSSGFNVSSTNNPATISVPTSGAYQVTWTLLPGTPCQTTAQQTITVTELTVLTPANLGTATCANGALIQPVGVPTNLNPLSPTSFSITAVSPSGVVYNLGQAQNTNVFINEDGVWTFNTIATLALGCVVSSIATASYDLPNASFPYLSDGNNPLCYSGNCYTIPAILNQGTYAWLVTDTNGATITTSTNDTLSVCTNGTFNVQLVVTGSTGCKDTLVQSTTFATMPQIAQPTVNVGNCSGGAVPHTITLPDLATNPAVSNWSLSIVAPNGQVNNYNQPGSPLSYSSTQGGVHCYNLMVEFTNGCKAERIRYADAVAVPNASILNDSVICNQPFTTLLADGQTGFLYEWTVFGANNQILGTSGQPSYTFTFPGSGTYTVQQITNAMGTGCPDTAIQQLQVVLLNPNDFPPLSAPVCINGTQQATLVVPPALIAQYGFTDWTWTAASPAGASTTISNSTNSTFDIDADGQWSFQFTGTSNQGCTLNAFFFDTYNPIANQPAAQIAACGSDTVFLNPNYLPGVEPDNQYQWAPAVLVSNPTSANPYVFLNQIGNQAFNVTVTNNAGCTYSGQVQIIQPVPPYSFSFDIVSTPCVFPVNVTAVGSVPATIVFWSNDPNFGTALSFGPDIQLDETTQLPIYVQGNFAGGCIVKDTLESLPFTVPAISISVPNNDCSTGFLLPVTATVSGGNGLTITWQPADIAQSTGPASADYTMGNTAQTITATVTNSSGCTATATATLPAAIVPDWSVNVTATPPLIVLPQTSQLNTELINSGGAGFTYVWSPAENLSNAAVSDPVAAPVTTTTYSLTVSDTNGCVFIDTITVEVLSIDFCEAPLTALPNAFTPNGDGTNDAFGFADPQYVVRCDVAIYDRWGNQVFTSYKPDFRWDGQLSGQPLPSDSYLAVVQITCVDGVSKKLVSDILLLR